MSVLKQDFTEFDLLIVDDGSTDNTVEVVQSYCRHDSRVRLVTNPSNLGLVRNWNLCLELAEGPLVQLLLSDDLIDPDYLSIIARTFLEYPSVGLAGTSCRYIDGQGYVVHPGNSLSEKFLKAGDQAVSYLLMEYSPHVSSVVFRKDTYENLGTFDVRLRYGPDVEMFARIASKYDIYLIGGVHTSFRRHGSNTGNINYLGKDFLEIDQLTRRMAWKYLSTTGHELHGIKNINSYFADQDSRVALMGVVLSVAYGQPKLGRNYLYKALCIKKSVIWSTRFWKSLAILIVPTLGKYIMEKRLKITSLDRAFASTVQNSLS
jgi:glycosyltransferase involved in cell wall biosynthesis